MNADTSVRVSLTAFRRNVLVVEDDPVARAVQRDIFSIEGWHVTLAASMEEGLQSAIEGHFDVVVCDLGLPDGDGMDLVVAMRGHPLLDSVPIVVVTGRTGSESLSAALAAGATDYVMKPFDSTELLARCRSALRAHDAYSRLASSERQLRVLADSTADLVVIVSVTGTVRYASPSSLALLGWDPSEIEGRRASKLFDPVPAVPSADSVVRDRRRVRRAAGDSIWIESVARMVDDEIVIWGRDVTEQVMADHRQTALSRARHAILSETGDSRGAVCAAAQRVTGALLVALLEPEGSDRLVVTSCCGADLEGFSVAIGSACLSARAFLSCSVHVAGAEVRTYRSDGLLWAAVPPSVRTGMTGAIHLPVIGRRGPRAVLTLALGASSAGFDRDSLEVLRLLAADAALAIEREDTARVLAEQAIRDPLTGLVNRRYLDRALQASLGNCSFAILDIDHFKEYNDTYGHQAGDRVLVAAADGWTRLIRPEDTLGRFGGEEFALVMPGCSLEVAERRVAVMRAALPPPITASAGVTEAAAGDSLVELVARADHALYAAKAAGRDCTVSA